MLNIAYLKSLSEKRNISLLKKAKENEVVKQREKNVKEMESKTLQQFII